MKILLSIKPEFAELILSGTKKYEFRKVNFQRTGIRFVVIYATLPIGKVIGEFEIGEVMSDTPSQLWKKTKESAGMSQMQYDKYFAGKRTAFALSVMEPRRFQRPLDIADFSPNGVAPQSFRYLVE